MTGWTGLNRAGRRINGTRNRLAGRPFVVPGRHARRAAQGQYGDRRRSHPSVNPIRAGVSARRKRLQSPRRTKPHTWVVEDGKMEGVFSQDTRPTRSQQGPVSVSQQHPDLYISRLWIFNKSSSQHRAASRVHSPAALVCRSGAAQFNYPDLRDSHW